MKNTVLIGGGNHVQYCIDIVEKEGQYNIVGIIDSKREIGESLFGYSVIGRQEELAALADRYKIDGGIITIGDNWSRHQVKSAVDKLAPGFEYHNAIHPSVVIGSNTTFGKGVVAMAGCIFNPGASAGDFTFFATGAQIEHDCTIEDFASVSAGTILGGHVRVGRFSALTLGVVVLDRLTIGENSVVGAGSLVTKSLPDNVLAYGSPAVVIRERKPGEKYLN